MHGPSGRSTIAKEVMEVTITTENPTRLSSLADERYISITTFRRDGTPASTPVWVVSDDPHRLLVATGAGTWKVRRIKRDPHVRVAGCSARGKVHGEAVEGVARLVEEEQLVRRLQDEKYGWQKRLIEAGTHLVLRLTRKPWPDAAYIEIVEQPNDPGESPGAAA
jgi:PPOX class probable F420-dependent enzyme